MNTIHLVEQSLPERLQTISQPPKELFIQSSNWEDLLMRPAVAIVGSRRPSVYGKTVTHQLASELARAGVVIVSGLAYGVDIAAHQAALQSGGITVAVLPAGLDAIYPQAHRKTAQAIVKQGGALISEYPPASGSPHGYQFVERNRLISGFSNIVIITEATLKSGSRHTADFAADQGKTLMVVPGEVTNPLSAGPFHHFQTGGATLITSSQDVLAHLGILDTPFGQAKAVPTDDNQLVIHDLICKGVSNGQALLSQSGLSAPLYQQSMTMLELTGFIRPLGNDHWAPG